jgi:hypothetical protein
MIVDYLNLFSGHSPEVKKDTRTINLMLRYLFLVIMGLELFNDTVQRNKLTSADCEGKVIMKVEEEYRISPNIRQLPIFPTRKSERKTSF